MDLKCDVGCFYDINVLSIKNDEELVLSEPGWNRYWSESWKRQDFQRLVAGKLVFTAVCSISASCFLKIKHLGKTEAAQRINVGEFASLILLNPPSLRSNKSYKGFHLGPQSSI